MIRFLVVMAALLWSTANAAPIIDQKAPDFTGLTSGNETISLSQFNGQKVVLEWTNHGCPYVQKHYNSGNMQSLQKRLAGGDNVVWITVISSAPGEQGYVTADAANELTTSRKAAPDYVMLDPEGDIGRLYAAKTTPHMFVIDELQIVKYAGAIDSVPTSNQNDIARAENYVELAMRSLRDGKAVVTKQTQPYGCSVKYAK